MIKKLLGITLALAIMISLTACGASEDKIDENASIGEQLDYTIIGIDPGSGIMDITVNKVLPEYGLEEKWNVVEGSGAAMTAALMKAINKEEPIIVTGWIPHWMFSKFDLKMLEDPKGVYGGKEDINTIVRKGFKEDMPGAYKFFDQFQWEPNNLQDVMVKIESGLPEQEAAKEWVEGNEDLVNSWIEGVEPGNGAEVRVPYVAWSDVIASSNVVKYVLENKLDYKVNLIQVDAGPMWASITDGSVDAMVGAWLPTTHAAYYDKYKNDIEDLGPNLTGTQNGLVVPAYMDINSIEDLKEVE